MRNRILMGLAVVVTVVLVGVLFGMWLSWHAPMDRAAEAPVPNAQGRPGEAPVAAADQQDYLLEPSRPRTDGSRGVPARPVMPAEAVPMVSAADRPQPDTLISTVAPDLQAWAPGTEPPGVSPRGQTAPSAALPNRNIDSAPSNSVVTVIAGANGNGADSQEGWAIALRNELARCSSQSMVTRVICNEQARWKYCNPDNRWGRIPECPRTGNN